MAAPTESALPEPVAGTVDDPRQMRRAGRELLSLAFIDARNHLLHWLAADESPPALRLAAHAGWWQEYWIARHMQRQRGEACDASATRLAGIEPAAEAWATGHAEPPVQALRAYLADTLETTLELLAAAAEDDAALHFYRAALLHEDRLCETLAERLLAGAPPARAERSALWLPGQRWRLGSDPGGMVPYSERWAHEVAVPEFEIDAQAVNWGRFVEFAEDGGYDRPELWSPGGWAWVQTEGRRAPRHVEQMHGGVLVLRGAGPRAALARAPAAQAVMHVSRHEAEAWCRWAGRRLPTEPEWELAAARGAGMGFVWGDVFEWVAGSARAYPGAGAPPPGTLDAIPAPGTQGVLRGASFATRARLKSAKFRNFSLPERDEMFCGFRTCAF